MRSSELQQLLERHRQILPMETRHRLLFSIACIGAGSWFLGPAFVPTNPPWWYLVAATMPLVAWVGILWWRRHLIQKDPRFAPLDSYRIQLQRADVRLIWPNDEEARLAPWQRPLIVVGVLFFIVSLVVGMAAVLSL